MKRRRFLGGTAGGFSMFAGCTTSPGHRSESPTSSPAIESRVDVPSCPKMPRPLARENVASFAIQFEKAYFTRRVLRENERVTYVEFLSIADADEADVTQTENGFIVRFSAMSAYGYRQNPGTPETTHADLPQYTAYYFITSETVRRAKAVEETAVDPRENGTEVHCPPQ